MTRFEKFLHNISIILSILILSSCSDSNNTETIPIMGKWTLEFETFQGDIRRADIAEQLSYIEFLADGNYQEFFYNTTLLVSGRYYENDERILIDGKGYAELGFTAEGNLILDFDSGPTMSYMRTENEQLPLLEPLVRFGAGVSAIMSDERRELIDRSNDYLIYGKTNRSETSLTYLFENNKLVLCLLQLSPQLKAEPIRKYLESKYTLLSTTSEAYFYSDSHTEVTFYDTPSEAMIAYTPASKSLDK